MFQLMMVVIFGYTFDTKKHLMLTNVLVNCTLLMVHFKFK